MKYKLISFLLTALMQVAISAIISYAQDYKSSIRSWNEGRLTWDDFIKKSYPDSTAAGILYQWSAKSITKKYGNLVVRNKLETECYMDKTSSWVFPDMMTENNLRHLQIIFDMAELYRRKLQVELDTTPEMYHPLHEFYMRSLKNTIDEFEYRSDNGKDTASLYGYEQRISSELEKSQVKDSVPSIKTKGVGFGCDLGVASEIFTGKAGSYISPVTQMIFSLDLLYKRSDFYIDIMLGGGRLKKDFTEDSFVWSKDKTLSSVSLGLSYAYTAFNNHWWKISPFAGIGYNVLDQKAGKDTGEENGNELGGLKVSAGINASLKLRRNLYLGQISGYSETYLRFKIYAAYTRYTAALNGISINLALCFGVLSQKTGK